MIFWAAVFFLVGLLGCLASQVINGFYSAPDDQRRFRSLYVAPWIVTAILVFAWACLQVATIMIDQL